MRCLSQQSRGWEKYLIATKNGPTEKRPIKPRQSRGHAVMREGSEVLITQNIVSPLADSLTVVQLCVFTCRRLQFATSLYTCEECWHITNAHTHACTNTAKLYPSHLNCRARSPSRSTGAQSLTTDIILIAHHGRVVCPHSHPDSLCAETQQRKTVVWECLEVCGQQWVSAVSLLNLSSSHPFDCLAAYPRNMETVERRPKLMCVCETLLDLKWEDKKREGTICMHAFALGWM